MANSAGIKEGVAPPDAVAAAVAASFGVDVAEILEVELLDEIGDGASLAMLESSAPPPLVSSPLASASVPVAREDGVTYDHLV